MASRWGIFAGTDQRAKPTVAFAGCAAWSLRELQLPQRRGFHWMGGRSSSWSATGMWAYLDVQGHQWEDLRSNFQWPWTSWSACCTTRFRSSSWTDAKINRTWAQRCGTRRASLRKLARCVLCPFIFWVWIAQKVVVVNENNIGEKVVNGDQTAGNIFEYAWCWTWFSLLMGIKALTLSVFQGWGVVWWLRSRTIESGDISPSVSSNANALWCWPISVQNDFEACCF